MKVGHGYDVHKFGEQGPITLGGIKIPYEQGFLAHSDGDVLIHALCDALLGAMALGDIGKHFPDTSAEFENIDSRILLRHVYQLITDKGFQLGNIDATIIAQAPKMAPHIPKMIDILSEDLKTELSNINIKATTTEKLGFAGRKEGIAVHCVVLLEQTL
ncbi:2-C-methyl-D-erythritol 2,4-cyclodiphosphate synthase [Catenovulum sediminis]|uniref:2-C-methyl-D-erythritol 2,4-cyclodiphosphate synthase n=1 Tax=Catenovulum sediminis TaxID=1740262 RepID=A0ABV1RGG9_9ALTE|nr:2-C-methyl-D-erythritol 2,4-cyclodiphosphate synthase [Catenovulum sediminis]